MWIFPYIPIKLLQLSKILWYLYLYTEGKNDDAKLTIFLMTLWFHFIQNVDFLTCKYSVLNQQHVHIAADENEMHI